MTSLLNLEPYAKPPEPMPEPVIDVAPAPESAGEFAEYEIVVGRRQIAGAALVAIVLLAVFSGVSYLIGKSMTPVPVVVFANQAPVAPAPAPIVPIPVTEPAPPAPVLRTITSPLFKEATPGQVYLQVGVIDRGLAGIWAEGLRNHGLDAFVAPGPKDGLGLSRVLIGSLPNPQAFERAKDTLDRLGVITFGRRYQP
jgi:hypothetical protein